MSERANLKRAAWRKAPSALLAGLLALGLTAGLAPTQAMAAPAGVTVSAASTASTSSIPEWVVDPELFQSTFEYINIVRAKYGAKPLRLGLAASELAQEQARVNAANGRDEHNYDFAVDPRVIGAEYSFENAGSSNPGGNYDLVDNWVLSPGHFAALTNPNVEILGLGLVNSGDRLRGVTTFFGGYAHPRSDVFDTAIEVANYSKLPAVASGTPVLDGPSAAVGYTLTAKPGTWSTGAKLSYEWLRDGKPVPGATGTTYTVDDADIDKTIAVKVTGTKAGYRTTTVVSDHRWGAERFLRTMTSPVITGSDAVGRDLKVTTGVWDPSDAKVTVQWLRDGSPIPGATALTYRTVKADYRKTIDAVVTAKWRTQVETVDAYGPWVSTDPDSLTCSTGSKWSPVTEECVAPEKPAQPAPTDPTAPPVVVPDVVNTVKPSVSGKTVSGYTLTAKPGTWTAGAAFTYQWLRDGTPIDRATGSTLKLSPADAGKAVSVKVTASKAGHKAGSAISAATSKVTLPKVVSTVKPKIKGSAVVGKKLTVSKGAWASGPSLSYQWLKNGKTIKGVTGTSYKVRSSDAGARISVTVKGTKSGYSSTSVTTAKTAKVLKVLKVKTPKIKGTPKAGKKLSVNKGKWTSGTKFTYQWLSNGKSIKGAKSSSYKVASKYKGKKISVRVTGKKSGYESRSVVSKAVKIRR